MGLAVVLPGVAVRGDGDGLLVLSDLQLAGLVGDGVVLGKRIVLQSVTGDGVGAGADERLAASDRHGGKAFSVHKRALGDRVVAVGQRRAVVRLAGAGRRQLDCNRRYRQLTNNGLAEGVARGHVGFAAHDYVARYHVVAAADVRLAALDNRDQNVALHQRARVGEAVIRQRRAVVNLLVAVRGDGNGLALTLALRDGQLAFVLGDGIVRLLEVRAFGVGDRVGHFALVHEGYAAGGLDIGHLAVHKAVAAHSDNRLRQRRAVVFLARRLGLQRHGALVDGQLAVDGISEGVVLRHVRFAALDHVALNDVPAFVAHVRGAALDDRGQHVAVRQHALGEGEAVIRQRGSVIGLFVALRGDGNRVFRDRVDLQNAVHDFERDVREVLIGVLEVARGDAHGVFARVRALRSPRSGFGRLDAGSYVVQLIVSRHGLVALDAVLIAVVGHGRAIFGDGDDNLVGDGVDLQNAVHDFERDVREVLIRVLEVARGDAHGVFASVRALRSPRSRFRRLDARGHIVQLVVSRHGLVALDAVLIAVVGHGRAIFGDGDDNLVGDGVDLQNAVHDFERDVREVLIRVLEVARGDAHGVFARVRALRSPRGGFGRLDALGHVVQRVVSRHGLVALDAVLITVVGHDGAVLRDGDGNLVGHGGDRHIAVNHCLDGHVVVGADDGEGVLGQTHVRRANVRAPGDGEYIGLEADRNLVRLAGEAVVVAVRLVLRAVVHSRFIDARDGDGGRSLVDGQRAVCIGYIIIGRNCAAVVFDGIRIDHVRGIARVGDGGGRRHGEGEAVLRVAVDQTLHFEIGLGQRLAVVFLIRALGGDGQRHGVIDRDDVAGRIDRDGLRGIIAGHNGGGIGGIERIALVRRQLFADGLGAGLVVGNLDGGAVQVMMDGVARGVELEVQLQHQRTVACDVAGKHVVLVIRFEHVLVVFLSRLIVGGNGNFRVRGGRALVAVVERVSATDVLIVELDGVLGVGVRRPDGVEDVLAAVVVHLHLRVGGDGAFALGVGVPALEGVADAGEGVCDGGDGLVIGEVFNHVLACAAIGFIGQGCASGTRAPLGGEGDDVLVIGVIALDLILVAGLVGGRAVRPAEEVLAISSNQLARGHEVSKAVLRVGLAILRSGYVVLAGNIFYSEGAVLGVVGVEGDVRCDLGLGVEGLAGAVLAGTPAAPGIAFANLRHDFRLLFVQRGFNRVALRDAECNR